MRTRIRRLVAAALVAGALAGGAALVNAVHTDNPSAANAAPPPTGATNKTKPKGWG